MKVQKNRLVEQLFSLQHGRIANLFRRKTRSTAESADLTQEAFLRLLRADHSQVIENPEAYLFTIASNLAKEHAVLLRRFASDKDVDDPLIEFELADWPSADDELDAAVRQRMLTTALKNLSPKCRAAVILQYRDGLTYQEIAERLDVSTSMVKKYLATALRRCRDELVPREDAP